MERRVLVQWFKYKSGTKQAVEPFSFLNHSAKSASGASLLIYPRDRANVNQSGTKASGSLFKRVHNG
jgi:hypothetical protein